MANSRYAQARADFEYLETIIDLDDQVDIDARRLDLMRNPTKAKAADMYERCIALWFQENRGRDLPPRANEIRAEYGVLQGSSEPAHMAQSLVRRAKT